MTHYTDARGRVRLKVNDIIKGCTTNEILFLESMLFQNAPTWAEYTDPESLSPRIRRVHNEFLAVRKQVRDTIHATVPWCSPLERDLLDQWLLEMAPSWDDYKAPETLPLRTKKVYNDLDAERTMRLLKNNPNHPDAQHVFRCMGQCNRKHCFSNWKLLLQHQSCGGSKNGCAVCTMVEAATALCALAM